MEPFDNFKGKLREESPLPEGFGWEDMQEGIFEKMEQIDLPQKESKRSGYWRLTFFLLGMGGMLGVITLFQVLTFQQEQPIPKNQKEIILNQQQSAGKKIIIPKSNTTTKKNFRSPVNLSLELLSSEAIKSDIKNKQLLNQQVSAKPTQKNLIDTKNLADILNINGLIPDDQINFKNLSSTKKEIGNAFNNQAENLEKRIQHQYPIKIEKTVKTPASKQKNNISPKTKEVEQSTSIAPPTAFNSMLAPSKTVIKSISTGKEKKIWRLTALEKKPLKSLNYLRLSAINSLSLSYPSVVEKRDNRTRFSMAIGIGVNYWLPNWETTTNPERTQYERAILGKTYSLQLGYQLKSNWQIGTGIQWSKNYSKFDYTQTVTQSRTKENALVEIQVNSFSGDSTKIYGDKTVNVERTRTVVHYNTFQKWAIPLTIKYGLKNRKMEYVFGFGTLLTLSTNSSGRTINATIIDYNATNPIYKSSLTIGAVGSFDLNYHFSKKYYIGTQLSIVKDLTNWSQTTDIALKPTLFHSQIMIGMKF